jgi:glycosyltransferase involved in cell wall biosynthesis
LVGIRTQGHALSVQTTRMTTAARIAFDARYINDRYHGIGRYAFCLLESLVAAAPGLTFLVFTGNSAESRFDWGSLQKAPNVEFKRGPWPLYWPQEQLAWLRILHEQRANLFHTPYFVLPGLARLPMINTVHDLIFDRHPEYMPKPWSRPYYKGLMQMGVRRARRILCVSRATAEDLLKYYPAAGGKETIILEGVDPHFSPALDTASMQRIRKKYLLEKPFILSVGARRPHKNQVLLMRAYAELAESIGHDLVLVGSRDTRFPDEAQQAVQSQRLQGRVHILDWVEEGDLPGLYRLADLVVQPSIIEGFGLPVLEAMASETPVIAANASSLPEVVGEAGLLVDPQDESQLAQMMRVALHDPKLRQRLVSAGRTRLEHFTWAQAAQAVLQVYQQVLR